MRPAVAILMMLAAPVTALAQHNTPPLLIPSPPAPTPPPLFVPPPVPSAVTPLPTPSYGVPPGISSTVPLGSGGTVRSVYRGSDGVPPKKKPRFRRPHQSSTR
jgi:hypothetical protein